MGFTPQQVNKMSMWQYYSVLYAYIEQNTPKGKEQLTEAELGELSDWLDADAESKPLYKTLVYLWDENGPVVDKEVTFTLD